MNKIDTITAIIKREESNIPTCWNIDQGMSYYFDEGLEFKVNDVSHRLYIGIIAEEDRKTYKITLSDEKVNRLGCIRYVDPMALVLSIKNIIKTYKEIKSDTQNHRVVHSKNFIVANDPNLANLFHWSHFVQ